MEQAAHSVADSLAQALREGTRAHHAQAERAGVMPALLKGQLPLAAYCELLHNLHAIYATLEPALAAHAQHPFIAAVWAAPLQRSGALASDLQALDPAGTIRALPLKAAAQAYAQRVAQLAHEQPQLLVAHAYVRYLGDLSGGQILSRIVGRAYGLTDGPGTRFYDFGSKDEAAALAARLRSGLNAVPADEAAKAAIVNEARSAFERHQALFVELQN